MSAEPAAQAPPLPGSALAMPQVRVPRTWISALSLANLAVWLGLYGPIQILLALQAAALAPHHKAQALAVVSGLGAAVSVVATPLFGAISDRTVSRFGRRIPWVVIGTAGGAVSLAVLAVAGDIPAMAAGWCLAQLTLSASYAALTAAVPDQVPTRQRGMVGGWLGVAETIGIVAGTAVATVAGGVTAGYLACAACTVLMTVPYVLMRRDTPLARPERPAFRWKSFLAGFWISPRRYPDFGWAWATRFLINLSNSVGTLYLLYYLSDAVHYRGNAATGVLILTVIDSVSLLATVVVAGIWSDRTGRRKAFVIWSAVAMAVATLVLAVWVTWTAAIIAALLLGFGYGAYVAVDFALVTDVLPTALNRGKDLGVINITYALPQAIAPAIAAPIVLHLGGYRSLYAITSVICLAGGVLVQRIRAVR